MLVDHIALPFSFPAAVLSNNLESFTHDVVGMVQSFAVNHLEVLFHSLFEDLQWNLVFLLAQWHSLVSVEIQELFDVGHHDIVRRGWLP